MTETVEAEETALYRIFGKDDLLLYIGVSNDFGRRWSQHAKKQPWWNERRRMTVDEWFDSRPEAEAAEEAAIKAEKPKYNKRHLVPVEYKHRKPRAVKPPASPVVKTTAVAVVADPPPAPRERDDRSRKVPYPYSLLGFVLPGHSMDGIDLSTPDGRFRAAEVFGAYEQEALKLRSFLEKGAAEMLEMERSADRLWAAPVIRKVRRNYAVLIGDGSSVDTDRPRVAAIMRENQRLSVMLAAALAAVADVFEAFDAKDKAA